MKIHHGKEDINLQYSSARTITFVGGGNMATAILDGCLGRVNHDNYNFTPESCHIIEVNPERRAFLEQEYAIKTHAEITSEIMDSQIILLAVKPQQMQEVAESLRDKYRDIFKNNTLNNVNNASPKPLIISIAAGIRLEKLNQWLGGYEHIVRAMPNMAALVHAGITGLNALASVTQEERDHAENLMRAVGDVLWFEEETQLDAVTAVSGSGPAYVFYFIEALQQAGESLGLSAAQARQLALKTFEGASQLAATSSESAATLRERVTSKGGTTEAAIKHLDNNHVKQHFIDAVGAAAKRAEELGE